MAINPSIFNFNQVRGESPQPGQLPSSSTVEYIIVSDGRGGVFYYRVGTPKANEVLANPAMKDQWVRKPIDESTHGNINDYHDTTEGAAAAVGIGAEQTTPPAPVPSAPAAPAPAPSPVGQPGVSQPSLAQPPAMTTQTSVSEAARKGLYVTGSDAPAGGRWMRVTPWDNNSDILGVDLVREGSDTGRAILADKNAKEGQQYQFVDTDWKHASTGAPIPEELTASGKFQAIARMPGMTKTIVDWSGDVPIVDAGGQPGKGYKVTFRMANGAEQTVTFARSSADGKESFQISGVPEIKLDGVNSPNKDALVNAQTEYQRAAAEYQRVQKEGGDLANAQKALELAEQKRNFELYGRSEKTSDIERSGLTVAQTRGQEATTAATIQGTQNQTYQNVLQYFRDRTGDEAKAMELTMQFFNNRANVDQNNNNLALRAGETMVNAETAANTQRVSLANNRLSQSNQGYTDDLKTSSDMNQYISPGSDKGFKGFMAMQALRYANAQKYGAFDVNDPDLKFDPRKMPTSVTAFANPTKPAFATYPDLPSMRDEAENTAMRLGGRERPAPPDHTSVVKPVQTGNPGSAPRTGSGTTAPPAPSAPAFTGYKPTDAGPSATPATVERAQATGQNVPAQGNERPDDIITYVTPSGEERTIQRRYWEGMDPEVRDNYRVVNAEPSRANAEPPSRGAIPSQPSTTQPGDNEFQPHSGIVPGVSAAPAQAAGNERSDDIIIYQVPGQEGRSVVNRSQWDQARARGEVSDDMLVQARSASDFDFVPGDDGVMVLVPHEGVVMPKIIPERTYPKDGGNDLLTTNDIIGGDVRRKNVYQQYTAVPVEYQKSTYFDPRYPDGMPPSVSDFRRAEDAINRRMTDTTNQVYDQNRRAYGDGGYTDYPVRSMTPEQQAQAAANANQWLAEIRNRPPQGVQLQPMDPTRGGLAQSQEAYTRLLEEEDRRRREEEERRLMPSSISGLFQNSFGF